MKPKSIKGRGEARKGKEGERKGEERRGKESENRKGEERKSLLAARRLLGQSALGGGGLPALKGGDPPWPRPGLTRLGAVAARDHF